jgi:energy-coupling factor transporter ATP-binding protein EcfA2
VSSARSRSDIPVLTSILGEVLAELGTIDRPDALVLIDGRSGSGKSTLARMLRDAWPGGGGVDLLAMDDIYPGWDGLAAASAHLFSGILAPRAAGEAGRWRRWDWDRSGPADEQVLLPGRPLIVEGAGALTAATAALADLTVWLDAPSELRRERALARDGETYAPHWSRWAAQEDRHIALHRPETRADRVYDVADPSIDRTNPSSR